MPKSKSAVQRANELLQETVSSLPEVGGAGPRVTELADYLRRVELEQERELAGHRIMATFGQPQDGIRVVEMSPLTVYLEGRPDGGGQMWTGQVALTDLLETWSALPQDSSPPHPLEPIIRAYWAHPIERAYKRYRKGILPMIASKHDNWDAAALSSLEVPKELGPVQGFLPNLKPDEPKDLGRPALLAVYDHFAALEAQSRPRGQMMRSALAMRLFVDSLMTLDRWHRNGRGQKRTVGVREIVTEWLLWKPGSYRPVREDSGQALRRALSDVDRLAVPVGRTGWYHPVRVNAVSGLTLSDSVEFEMILPPDGHEASVGPPIDLRMSRLLGYKSPSAFRAYIALVCDWDRYGGKKGKVVLPTAPKALRNERGQIVDQAGNPVYRNGKPVFSWRHPQAVIPDPDERESNPARTCYQPYDEAAVRRLALPRHESEDSRNRARNTSRAMKYVEHILDAGGAVIETLGHSGGFPWRIMPPVDFNRIPYLDLPEEIGLQMKML